MATFKEAIDSGNPNNVPDYVRQLKLGSLLNQLAVPYTETVDTTSPAVLAHTPLAGSLVVQVNATISHQLLNGSPTGAGEYTLSGKTITVGTGHATTRVSYLTLDKTLDSDGSFVALSALLAEEYPDISA